MPHQQSPRHAKCGNCSICAGARCNDSRHPFEIVQYSARSAGVASELTRVVRLRSVRARGPALASPGRRVATTGLIRHRLISIVLLGVVTSALSLFALERALSTSMSVRRQTRARHRDRARSIGWRRRARRRRRSRPARCRRTSACAAAGCTTPRSVARAPGLPAAWLPHARGRARRGPTSSTRASSASSKRRPIAWSWRRRRRRAGGFAWVAYVVVPLAALQTWRLITIALAIATALLVFTAVWATLAVPPQRRRAQRDADRARQGSDDAGADAARRRAGRHRRRDSRHVARSAKRRARRPSGWRASWRRRSGWRRSDASPPASPTRCAIRWRRSSCASI